MIRSDVPLYLHTSLRVGGRAHRLVEPNDPRDAVEAIRSAGEQGLDWVGLGGGTNTVFLDGGYPGLVVRTHRLLGLTVRGSRLTAAAGEPLSHLVRRAIDAGLSGLEWAAGIPGSVGGAIAMNAGSAGGRIADVLVEVESVSGDGATRRSSRDLALGYRESAYRTGRLRELATEAVFDLVPSAPEPIAAEVRRILKERAVKFPTGATAGCTFRNPPDGPTAGELLDRAGCKRMRVGAAHVSERHANFIVNDGARNADDVLRLIEKMKRRVRETFGVELVEEIDIYPRHGTTTALDTSPTL